jgi:hypothetical protein
LAGLQTYGLLIRPAKTSYTAGTLCAIFWKFSEILLTIMTINDLIKFIGGNYGEAKDYIAIFIYSGHWKFNQDMTITIKLK